MNTSKSKTMGLTIGMLAALAMLLGSGCMQMAGVSKYDRLATARAFQAQVRPGEVLVGVDLLAIDTGYIAAWRAAPGEMALRTGGDIVTTGVAGLGTYFLGKQAGWWGGGKNAESGTGNAEGAAAGPRVTTVNGHTININSSGSGNTTVVVTDDHSSAPPPEAAPPAEVVP